MDISMVPRNSETIRTEAIRWLDSLLVTPSLSGYYLPPSIRGYIYIDGAPRALVSGSWQVASDIVYLARNGDGVPVMTKLAILTAIANMTRAIENNIPLMEKISTRLVEEIKASTIAIHNLMIASPVRPNRLAIDQVNCRVAADMNGSWFLPGGAPIGVDNTWIIMDF